MTIICRVCLATSEAKMYHRLTDVFPVYFKSSLSVLNILQTVTSATVSVSPGYPYAICTACLKCLKECYAFITKFHEAQDVLKKKMENQLNLMLAKAEEEIMLKVEPVDEESVDPLLIETEPPLKSPSKPILKKKNVSTTRNTLVARKSNSRTATNKTNNVMLSFEKGQKNGIDVRILEHNYTKNPDCQEQAYSEESSDSSEGSDDCNTVETIKIINIKKEPKDNSCGNVVLMSVEDVLNLKQRSQKTIPQTSSSTRKAQVRRNNQRRLRAKTREKLHCSICSKTYNTQKGLLLHQYVHTPDYLEDLKCKECGYQCTTKSGSIHHRQKHDGNEYKCDECGKRVFSKWQVLEHKRRMHVGLPEKFMCSECGKRFKYNSALKYHMISAHHIEDKEYLCGFCGYKCVTKAYLKRHERCHTDERPYKCKLCPKAFRGSAELQSHLMAHEQKKRHYCKYCKKGFIAIWNMKVHWLQHEGSHACELCSKSFADEFILKFHYFYRHRVRDKTQLKEKEQIEIHDDTVDDNELLP